MLEAKLNEVKAEKRRATALRNRGQLPRALAILEQATQTLESLQSTVDASDLLAKEIRGELADTWGMRGGVLRRQNAFNSALDAYRAGRGIEDIDGQSTYNLSNVITLNVTFVGRSPRDPDVRQDLRSAVNRLEVATAGPRKDEWWAWADLAQFYLLSDEPDTARAKYAAGRKTGPPTEEINRHVAVLRELMGGTAKTAPEVSQAISAAIKELTE